MPEDMGIKNPTGKEIVRKSHSADSTNQDKPRSLGCELEIKDRQTEERIDSVSEISCIKRNVF